MLRNTLSALDEWAERSHPKPLIIRGARQVGKTTLVRIFAEQRFERLVELNFERDPHLASLFSSNDPRRTLELLALQVGGEIRPRETLLFLDEIQAAPEVLAALRYFYEELPELHVVAAGSLLELALENPNFSVPVGRIEYLHLAPMHFDEFLVAAGESQLRDFLRAWQLGDEIPEALHLKLSHRLQEYFLVGGMPEAVKAWLESGSYRESERVKHSILATFHDDFGKYGRTVDTRLLRKVFERLPHLVGGKLKYVHIDREERSKDLADALHQLSLARVAAKIPRTAANGVPLGAEASERDFKILCLDIGLMTTACGLSALDLELAEDPLMVHRGALAEQFVGQHLLGAGPSWETPRLYYWARDKRGSSAEVDYLLAVGGEIVPVEVKAGKTGTLKSLHLFLREKGRRIGLRLSSQPPSLLDATTSLPDGRDIPFRLLSLPLYLVGEAPRLIVDLLRR